MVEAGATRIRRPRMGPAREHELLTVALELLREVGYEAVTMDELAVRGRCSKATLYRMWPSKPQLLAAAIRSVGPIEGGVVIDTGSLRADILAICERFIPRAENDTATIAALNHAVLTEPELGRSVRETMLTAERVLFDQIIGRAVARGELSTRPACAALIPQLVFGVVVTRPIYEDAFANFDFLVRMVDTVIIPALHHG